MLPPVISLEEHFFSSAVLESFDSTFSEQFKAIPGVKGRLQSLGTERLADMDDGAVTMQVISHACAPEGPDRDTCTGANDQLSAAVNSHPTRFAGFAVLPVGDPQAAADELYRAVEDLGFVGALIDNHFQGRFFDSPDYDVLWQAASALNVPIYLHPTWPTAALQRELYAGNFSNGACASLGASGWGWHTATGLHVLRLFAAGTFDRFPALQIIVGHMGEMLPFQFQRICQLSKRWGVRERDFRRVWNENLWITTSGVWSLDPLRCILGNTKVERILFAVDYPFEPCQSGKRWMEELQESGLVTPEQLEMIAFRNAEKLLRIKVVR